MTKKQIKKCPKCQTLFECCGDTDCWCESVQVPSKAMKLIMMTYTDCICPACLNEKSAQ